VTVLRLVLHVRRRDRDAASLLFGSLVDLIERHKIRAAQFAQRLRDRSRQRRLAVVDMPNRANIAMRLSALKFLFSHRFFSRS